MSDKEQKLSEIEPLPCPFCGSNNVVIHCGEWFYISCDECRAAMGRTNRMRFALEAWNKRAVKA